MTDETTTPTPPDTAPPAAAPAAESMVSAALLRESQATASALEMRVVELESELHTRTGELDTARTSARRLSVRMATGIDDDQIADMAHARWSAAMDGVAEQVEVGAWWKTTAADEELRAGMPRALQVYLPQQQADDPPAPPVERRGAGTPPHTRRPHAERRQCCGVFWHGAILLDAKSIGHDTAAGARWRPILDEGIAQGVDNVFRSVH